MFESLDLFLQGRVDPDISLDLGKGMDDGGVVLPELGSDLGEGGMDMFATEVHSNLTGEGKTLDPSFAGQITQAETIVISDDLLDLLDRQDPFNSPQDIFEDTFRKADGERDPVQ